MTLLKTFWTPIVVYPDVKTGCKFVAAYTIAISIFLMALLVHMQNGGESTQMYNPFFEANLRELNYYVVYTLIFFAYMVGSSLLLLKGLNNNLRGFLLPWLIGMGFVVIFLLVWSIWLLYGYYIYIHIVCAAVIYWIVAAMQFYCWLCVYTQYRVINEMQSPNIELLIF
ncbi:uncharacterized protein LOC132949351 [Metopolophium dirhodum]|uniref:uncharacterized protein LOC132949351 n=1 Tax=Metopolophium dirhodum TaxID=44670 RepID=UPI00298F6F62|nr:uncharacterized protein LOC132949351 [Metopolophium dirhodum]XP_060876183.1 uncharacterized protein LOC132949351 [Metopolophium dirhodum]